MLTGRESLRPCKMALSFSCPLPSLPLFSRPLLPESFVHCVLKSLMLCLRASTCRCHQNCLKLCHSGAEYSEPFCYVLFCWSNTRTQCGSDNSRLVNGSCWLKGTRVHTQNIVHCITMFMRSFDPVTGGRGCLSPRFASFCQHSWRFLYSWMVSIVGNDHGSRTGSPNRLNYRRRHSSTSRE